MRGIRVSLDSDSSRAFATVLAVTFVLAVTLQSSRHARQTKLLSISRRGPSQPISVLRGPSSSIRPVTYSFPLSRRCSIRHGHCRSALTRLRRRSSGSPACPDRQTRAGARRCISVRCSTCCCRGSSSGWKDRCGTFRGAGFPLRGDQGLPDAGRRRAAGSANWSRSGCNSTCKCTGRVRPPSHCAAAWSGISPACSTCRWRGAARPRADRGCASHPQPRDAGGAGPTTTSRCPRRPVRCHRGGRPMPPERPACACSSQVRRAADRRHSRLLHYRWLPQGATAQPAGGIAQVASESWVLGRQSQIDPASQRC